MQCSFVLYIIVTFCFGKDEARKDSKTQYRDSGYVLEI